MARVFLYSFYEAQGNFIRAQYYDNETYAITTQRLPYAEGGDLPLEQPEPNTFITFACSPDFRQMSFFTQDNQPYAYKTEKANSLECGYVPQICDIGFNAPPTITDESEPDANDGIISILATSSYAIQEIQLIIVFTDGAFEQVQSNQTGYFTGVTPGNYRITAVDTNGCRASTGATVYAASENTYHYKYKQEFNDIRLGILNRVEFYDMKHNYDPELYPLDLPSSESPLKYKIALQSESKSEAFAPSSIVSTIQTDNTFNVNEFDLTDERTWFVKYYQGDNLRFQGWLLPDQIQDLYDDPPYDVELCATDGLLSLKGEDFGSTNGVQQFGIKRWMQCIRWCLNKLGYDYGNLTIIKSLQYDGQMDWSNVGVWVEQFYDEDGVPVTAYDALETLLRGFGLTIFQQGGKFILCDMKFLVNATNNLKANLFNAQFYEYDSDFNLVNNGLSVIHPHILLIGDGGGLQPINGPHALPKDSAYSQVIGKVDFNLLTLLYQNPSFEIGAVQGVLPPGAENRGNGVPGSGLTNEDSYLGDWSLKVFGNEIGRDDWFQIGPFPIDQTSKLLNVSFNWKVPYNNEQFGVVPSVSPVFITGGVGYYLQQAPYRSIDFADPDNPYSIDYPDNSNVVYWEKLNPGEYHSEGDAVSIKPSPTNDFTGWQSFSITSPILPGAGDLYFRFYGAKLVPYDDATLTPIQNGLGYVSAPYIYNIYYLLDNLILTVSDANDVYNKQVGETHTVTNLTNFAKAQKETFDIDLFNYTGNKRIAGNVFYGLDYPTASNNYLWSDPLQQPLQDRLPGIITRQLARSYQRPMYKFSGDVLANWINFLNVFNLRFYEDKNFIPYIIELDAKLGEATITVCESDDNPFQSEYKYLAKFEKSAKKVRG